MGVAELTASSTNKPVALMPHVASMSDSTKFTVQMVKPPVQKHKRIVPKDIPGQLGVVFGNAKFEMEYIPKWLNFFGIDKLKNELTHMIDSTKFRTEIQAIFESAREKHKAHDKDVIELLKKRDVFDQVYNCMQANAKEKSLLSTVFKIDYVRERYYKMVKNGSPDDLLYKEY